ncbi:MAG: hypothetical protein ACOY3I_10235 [Verrucomicrobiota bacterium]
MDDDDNPIDCLRRGESPDCSWPGSEERDTDQEEKQRERAEQVASRKKIYAYELLKKRLEKMQSAPLEQRKYLLMNLAVDQLKVVLYPEKEQSLLEYIAVEYVEHPNLLPPGIQELSASDIDECCLKGTPDLGNRCNLRSQILEFGDLPNHERKQFDILSQIDFKTVNDQQKAQQREQQERERRVETEQWEAETKAYSWKGIEKPSSQPEHTKTRRSFLKKIIKCGIGGAALYLGNKYYQDTQRQEMKSWLENWDKDFDAFVRRIENGEFDKNKLKKINAGVAEWHWRFNDALQEDAQFVKKFRALEISSYGACNAEWARNAHKTIVRLHASGKIDISKDERRMFKSYILKHYLSYKGLWSKNTNPETRFAQNKPMGRRDFFRSFTRPLSPQKV